MAADMEGIVAHAPIEPAEDTGPISKKKLLPEQQQILEKLYAHLAGFVAHAAERTVSERPSRRPWASPIQSRRNQVLMLDGGRGTGKTSLLLTALKHLADEPSPSSVITLEPVDFDPMPQGMSPFSWVVLTLRQLVEWLEKDCAPKTTPPFCWDDDNDAASTLEGLWQVFFKRAEMGWSAPTKQDDIEDFIQRRQSKQRGWLKLQEAWEKLINGLFKALEKRNVATSSSIILLPIDDLDLAPKRAREVLLTLRQLYHKRVVFLLTGDSKHLTEVVALRQFAAEWVSGAFGQVRKDTLDRTKGLAGDLVAKVIQTAHRIAVWAIAPEVALAFAARQAGFVAPPNALVPQDALPRSLVPEARVPEYVQHCLSDGSKDEDVLRSQALQISESFRRSGGSPFGRFAFRIRDLMQALATHSASPKESFRRLLSSARPSDGSGPVDWTALRDRRLGIRATSRSGTGGDETYSWMRSTGFRAWDEDRDRPLNLIEEVMLQAELMLVPPDWTASTWLSPLASTSLRISLRHFQLPWPGIRVANLTDAFQKQRDLSYLEDRGVSLFRAWLLAHLVWFGTEPSLAPATSADEALQMIVVGSGSNPEMRTWLLEELPILCAPEHHLDDDLCYRIFAAVSSLSTAKEWNDRIDIWSANRLTVLRAGAGERSDEVAEFVEANSREHAWFDRHIFGKDVAWYDFRSGDDRQLSTELNAVQNPVGMPEPDLLATLQLHRFGDSSNRPPHWATRALTRHLIASGHLRDFTRAIAGLINKYGKRWPTKYLVDVWRLLFELTPPLEGRAANASEWFDAEDRGLGLTYRGPAGLTLLPEWLQFEQASTKTAIGWTASIDLPEHLVAWLCVIQSFGSRLPEPMEQVSIPPISASNSLPAWPSMDWLTAEHGLCLWEEALKELAKADHVRESTAFDVRLFNWLKIAVHLYSGFRPLHLNTSFTIPALPEDISRLLELGMGKSNGISTEGRPVIQRWLRNVRSDVVFDDIELREAWDFWWQNFSKREQRSQLETESLALGQLSNMGVDELREVVRRVDVARKIHRFFRAGSRISRLAELKKIDGVGKPSVDKIKAWAESTF